VLLLEELLRLRLSHCGHNTHKHVQQEEPNEYCQEEEVEYVDGSFLIILHMSIHCL
jgi:hypothetical protein